MNEERFQVLVEKYLEGGLSEDEARELLEAPEPFRSRLLDEVALAGALSRVRGGTSPGLADRVRAALRAPGDKEALTARVLGGLGSRRRRAPWLSLAAAALVAVALGALLRPHAPPPPAPSFTPAPEVRRAVDRAVAFLRASKLPDCTWQAPLPADDLVVYALHHAGLGPSDPFFKKLLDRTLAATLQRTYSVSLHAMLLASLDPAAYRERLADCAQFLVDNQCINGQWSYGTAVPARSPGGAIVKRRDGPVSGNNSCSAFAAHGLRACADAGLAVPRETLARASRAWRDSQRFETPERGGWCYTREEQPHHPYGSMSAAGLAALATLDGMLGEDWRRDRAAKSGHEWLTYHFTVLENFGPVEELMAKEMISDTPNPMTEFYFYLWGLERAAAACGADRLGAHDWYAEGVHELLATQQRDGSWYGGAKRCQRVWDTCYAILFLTRSSRARS
jgi:hypothetical protein